MANKGCFVCQNYRAKGLKLDKTGKKWVPTDEECWAKDNLVLHPAPQNSTHIGDVELPDKTPAELNLKRDCSMFELIPNVMGGEI